MAEPPVTHLQYSYSIHTFLRTKSLSLNKEHSSELVFLIMKLSSDDINHINFYLFGRLLKFLIGIEKSDLITNY